jgi:putative spermidine/putrescine transport system ATP-binding protein
MNKGRIEQVDPPYAMYERPRGRFVSTFLGKANVLYGRVGHGVFLIDSLQLPVPPDAPDGDSDYMVRPERIRLVGANALLTGRVRARSFQGNHWMYLLETPIGTLQVAQANSGATMPEEGAQVGIAWSAEDVRLLPRPAAA